MYTQTYFDIETSYRHQNIVRDYERVEGMNLGLNRIFVALRSRLQSWMAATEEPARDTYGHLQLSVVG